jgi:hypothetical protein
VINARQDTCSKYKADPLGIRRGPEFSLEVRVPHCKVGMRASHETLWGEVSPQRIQGDVRKLMSTYRYSGQREHGFRRACSCPSMSLPPVS